MTMLSALLLYRVIRPGAAVLRLDDLAIDISAAAYPPVTHLLCHEHAAREPILLPWADVKRLDHRRREIHLARESAAHEETPDASWLDKAILLKRDILDAVMLDLQARAAVLANDVWLETQDGALVLRAVDVGLLAALRRVFGGRIHPTREASLHDWRYIEFLHGNPAAASAGLDYHRLVDRLPPGEIAYLADGLPYRYAAELLAFLPDTKAASTLEMMIPELQIQVFEELGLDHSRRLLENMRPDIAADLLTRVEPETARQYLEHMESRQYDRVVELLRYPHDTAGGIMTNDMLTLPADTTVTQAHDALVKNLKQPDYPTIIQFFYVVDSETTRRLQGVLSLRDLLTADRKSRVGDLMSPFMITLQPLTPALQAARRVIESGLPALPVTAPDNRVLGIVTIDSALALTMPRRSREVLRLFTS